MTRHILIKSRSRLCGKLEFDIMHYCALNPFKLTKGLRNLFRIAFDKKFFIKRDRLSNIFSKADKKLSKLFSKKKSYYYSILVLKKRIRFFFGVISDHFIHDQLFSILKYKKSVKGLKIMDALARSFEMRIDFFVLRLRYVFLLRNSRDFVLKGMFLVNGVRIFDPFFKMNLGDIVKPFSIASKILLYKSLYLCYFGEYIAKSGFLRNTVNFILFKFYLYRFRKKLFLKKFKSVRLFYKKILRQKILGSLFWISIINVRFFQFWQLFSHKSFLLNISLVKNSKNFIYLNNKKKKSIVPYFLSKQNFNRGCFIYSKNFITILKFLKFVSIKKIHIKTYLYSFYYLVGGFFKFYNNLKSMFLYFKLLFIIRSFFSTKNLILHNLKKISSLRYVIYLSVLLKFKLILKKLILLKNLSYKVYLDVFKNIKYIFFSNKIQLINSFSFFFNNILLQRINYNFDSILNFNVKFKIVLEQISVNINSNIFLNEFFLFNLATRFIKRFFFSFNKLFFIKFFLLTKKLRNLSWSFFIIFLKLKLKARLKKKYKNLRLYRRKKKIRFRRISILDFIFKKRRLMRLWSLRLVERIFNLLQFFKFAVRKKLRFYKLRKREYSFFLMGKDYKTRRKFFKKYRKFTALNYIKYTLYRFSIFIRKRFYRYNNNKKLYKIKRIYIYRKKKKRLKKGIYISMLSFFFNNSRYFLLRRYLNFLKHKKLRRNNRLYFMNKSSKILIRDKYNIFKKS